jgi:hypothetical protein
MKLTILLSIVAAMGSATSAAAEDAAAAPWADAYIAFKRAGYLVRAGMLCWDHDPGRMTRVALGLVQTPQMQAFQSRNYGMTLEWVKHGGEQFDTWKTYPRAKMCAHAMKLLAETEAEAKANASKQK